MTLMVGVGGATIILALFLLNQANKISNSDFRYDLGNFIGAALLVLYAYLIGSWPFLILNSVWALFSLKDVLMRK